MLVYNKAPTWQPPTTYKQLCVTHTVKKNKKNTCGCTNQNNVHNVFLPSEYFDSQTW